jgi:hypothetical protein
LSAAGVGTGDIGTAGVGTGDGFGVTAGGVIGVTGGGGATLEGRGGAANNSKNYICVLCRHTCLILCMIVVALKTLNKIGSKHFKNVTTT